jgi:hypothetical protein
MGPVQGQSNQPGVPGVEGLSTVADGTRGDTQSSANNGVVGTNTGSASPPPGAPAGNGVFGYSKVPNANGVFGAHDGAGAGVAGFSSNGDGTRGDTQSKAKNGVVGTNSASDPAPAGVPAGNGIYGFSTVPNASGVFGYNNSGSGVSGSSATGVGVSGTGGIGVSGGGNVAGVSGNSQNIGVVGHGTATGVFGTVYAPNYTGPVYLTNLPPFPNLSGLGGVFGLSVGDNQFGTIGLSSGKNGAGVFGITTGHGGIGVSGEDYNGIANPLDHSGGTGVSGTTIWGVGVYGLCSNADKSKGWAGRFDGNVQVNGTLFKSAGGFKIDHPLEPNNKYLCHSFVESPEMLNVYSGTATLDSNGEAPVPLPKWFEALNNDFRYQLTCVGAFAPVYVGEEIKGGTFKIAGGNPGMKVCWQVTGVRCDAYAQQNRVPVEMEKPIK